MLQSATRAALFPLTSSPRRLSLVAVAFIAAVIVIQTISGVPHWRDFAPIELSSNVVAAMGVIWAALQLRTHRADRTPQNAWAAALLGMTLLAIDGDVVELVVQSLSETQEMNVSIALWICAAGLFFFASRRLAPQRDATLAIGAGFGFQLLAQYAGWLSVGVDRLETGTEVAGFLNDLGELAATLAYLSGLLLVELAPFSDRKAVADAPLPMRSSPAVRAGARAYGKVVPLSEFRRSVVRCPEAGVAFPQLFRISGFVWREQDGADPEREPHVAYAFDEDETDGVEAAHSTLLERPDPALDSGWVIVRHHRNVDALDGYLDARRDFGLDKGGGLRRLDTSDGIFTVSRQPAPASGPAGVIVYAARVPAGDEADDALWTLAIGANERKVSLLPARDGPEFEIWID